MDHQVTVQVTINTVDGISMMFKAPRLPAGDASDMLDL